MSAALRLRGVSKRFDGRAVVDDVSFTVEPGTVAALLGPSGSGKSTLLRLIAGLEDLDAGAIDVGGVEVATRSRSTPPEARPIGYVFQSFALFPHLTAAGNVAFGARDRAVVPSLLARVGLAARAGAAVATLSGGEQQRVALARALARSSQLVLLDEPFANLDLALRHALRHEVATTLRASGATAVLVTHDAGEAYALADQVIVLVDGKVVQAGAPEDVYHRPSSLEVARRTGELVQLPGQRRGARVATWLGELAIDDDLAPATCTALVLALRPEQLSVRDIDRSTDSISSGAPARVVARVFEGPSTQLTVESAGGERLTLRTFFGHAPALAAEVAVADTGPVRVFPA